MGKKELEIKLELSRELAVQYLNDLAACLAQGRVVVQKGGDYAELTPAQLLSLELEVSQKKDRQKLSLELSWRTGAELAQAEPLAFASAVPAPAPEADAAETALPLACPPPSCCGVGRVTPLAEEPALAPEPLPEPEPIPEMAAAPEPEPAPLAEPAPEPPAEPETPGATPTRAAKPRGGRTRKQQS